MQWNRLNLKIIFNIPFGRIVTTLGVVGAVSSKIVIVDRIIKDYFHSYLRCSIKKILLNILQNSQENTGSRVFFNKVAGLSSISSTVIFEKIRLSVKIKLEFLLLNFNKLMLVGDFYSDVKYLLTVINKNSTL